MTLLFITVGGSPQPVVTAILSLQPERVIFICSEGARGSLSQVVGTGTPCEIRRGTEVVERLPNIPTQTGLSQFDPEQDLIPLSDPDDLAECYQKISVKLQKTQQDTSPNNLQADYTGGTKTMSVALALAALDHQVPLFLTTGNRTDLIRVTRGELTSQATLGPVVAQRVLDQLLPSLLLQYNYPAALAELRQLLTSLQLPAQSRRQVQVLHDCCAGLDAWDRFDHLEAWGYLSAYMNLKAIRPLGLYLRQVIYSRAQVDDEFDGSQGTKGHGLEIIEDLLLNAERRAHQHRYDDAVGRIYRAFELLAQFQLWSSYQIKTGQVDLMKLPETLRTSYQSRENPEKGIQLGLHRSYELLNQLKDPIGLAYMEKQSLIRDTLQIRNYSLFAHGFRPIEAAHYQQIQATLVAFLQNTIASLSPKKALRPPQFPTTLPVTDRSV